MRVRLAHCPVPYRRSLALRFVMLEISKSFVMKRRDADFSTILT
jgi:hypothetical protein